MNSPRLVVCLASLTAGVGLGVLISFFVFSPDRAEMNASPQSIGSIYSSENIESGNSQQPASNSLAMVIELESPIERRAGLYQLVNNKSSEQITEFIKQTFDIENVQSSYSVQRLLFAELARIDPAKSLELVWKTARIRWGPLLDVVAMQWSMSAPDNALRAFSVLEEPWKSRALAVVFQHQDTLDVVELKDLTQSLNITDTFVKWTYEGQLAAVIDEPRKAFTLALEADTSYFHRHYMLTQIARRWVEREGIDDISTMLSLVYDVFADTRFLWSSVVSEIAAPNPELAWKQLSSMPLEIQKLFADDVFDEWFERDPDAAIEAIRTQEYVGAMASEMYSHLLTWIRAVSDRILEYIELVPEDYKMIAIEIAVEHLAEKSPPNEIIDLLTQLRLRGFNTQEATSSFVSVWSTKDPLAAVEWASDNLDQGPRDGHWMLRTALERLALSDPERAMEFALKQPEERRLEDVVILELMQQGELDKGLSFLPQIRETSGYPYIYNGISYHLIVAGRIEDALALADRLEEAEKPQFYSRLVYPWLRFELESLLEFLPKLPTEETRRTVAIAVLGEQERYPYLTANELDYIRSLLPDETN
ncbi:MAG: hypothetical protein F4X56_08345 [Gammaproteobacteria bacterium]|nr:hypothetical protein [Gammaproteobacteria bacterium]MYC25909.1 hypothetical protein [Gammaproteobacteria bacterium]